MERILVDYRDGFSVQERIHARGFGKIKSNIKKYNRASVFKPFFVLTDLDQVNCAPELIDAWLTEKKTRNLIFRVAVHEVESWILADRQAFASFLGISVQILPQNPDDLIDPKRELFSLAARSRKKEIKSAILPLPNALKGPDYNGVLSAFVRDLWSPESAAKKSPSLMKTIVALERYLSAERKK